MNIWVTRDERENGPLSAALRREGLQPIVEPVIRRHTIDDARELLMQLGTDDWVALTSASAVASLSRDEASVPCAAVIGEGTAQAARAHGMRVELVARYSTVDSLFAELMARIGSRHVTVCYPRSSLAATPPPLSPNVRITSPVVYETLPIEFDRGIVARVDGMAVTSASAVRAVGSVTLKAASIGPSTSNALRELGMTPWVEAPQPTFESLARAIADQVRASRHHRA